MALQVWLPLNGNLDNNGLSNITITNNGAIISDSGKIGKCYSFNQNTITLSAMEIGDEFSVAYWVKFNDLSYPKTKVGVKHSAGAYTSTNKGWDIGHGSSNSSYNFDINDGSNIQRISFSVSDLGQINVWKHFVLTCSLLKREVNLYVNGVLVGTKQINSSIGSFSINRVTTIGNLYGWYFDGYLNDFRIYDHCLSPKEVKEISKGLILHYPLNFYPKNLIPFLLTTENYTSTNYQNYTSSIISNGVYHVDGYQHETPVDTWFQIKSNSYISLPSNKTLYLSFYCKHKNTVSTYFGTSGYSGITRLIDDSNNNYFPQSQVTIGTKYDGRVILTFITGSSTNYKLQIGMDTPNLYGVGSYIDISKIMISEDKTSDYLPYDNTNIIYDCSGYENNGTIIGTLSSDSNSPRYKYCTQFGSGKYISPSLWPSFLTNECTISMWVKLDRLPPSSPGRTMLYTAWYGFSCEITSAGKTYFRTYLTNGTADSPSGDIETGNWIHWVGVKSSTGVSLYLNGILIGTTSNTNNFNWSSNVNNKIASYITSYFLYGKMSDLRLYSTALSEESIKELYNTSALIDNHGNLDCFDILESVDNLLKYENTIKFTKESNTDTRGKLVTWNNVISMAFKATDTYYGSGDERNGKLLYGMFKENTQYVFDLWLDVDTCVYPTDGLNKCGGFYIIYTDGTSYNGYVMKGADLNQTPIGWQHKVYISTANKTVRSMSIYYWGNFTFYVRGDSFIAPVTETNITKSGIVNTGQFIETDECNIGMSNIDSSSIIEI